MRAVFLRYHYFKRFIVPEHCKDDVTDLMHHSPHTHVLLLVPLFVSIVDYFNACGIEFHVPCIFADKIGKMLYHPWSPGWDQRSIFQLYFRLSAVLHRTVMESYCRRFCTGVSDGAGGIYTFPMIWPISIQRFITAARKCESSVRNF